MDLRASQVNGCAYCLDMHWKDLRAGGETAQRLYSLEVGRESPFYTDRERAALEWTEALTLTTPDEVYEQVRQHLCIGVFTQTSSSNLIHASANQRSNSFDDQPRCSTSKR